MDQQNSTSAELPKAEPSIFKGFKQFFIDVYDVFRFIFRFFKEVFAPPYEFRELIKQCWEVGVRSLLLITVTGFIVGLIFTKQSRPSLLQFGATSWIPSLVSIAIMRALAPLVTALISAGRVGSSIGAELGSMRVTEQIDAMEVSGTHPFKYLVCMRTLATTIAIPLLSVYNGLIAMLGGYLNVYVNEGTSFTTYVQQFFQPLGYIDFFSSLAKATIFGFTIGIVGSYKGWNSSSGTAGVGKAANSAVVTAMFLVFIEEVIIVQITGWFR
ncbi:MlaE family ABC transporter permease [Mucilaginibacter aquatilis]|uniref:ABC transporter permease n=1 Tax=Mucilaginibacter aquatilis TaxID=1517760 RepID=A0A6I4I8F1_9SPHI|nr:ABC transporter permease [Mucilaginibacter aquatilis]MVN89716.1 ABC transporter permease [Mucilaginibacter aquatilis]